MDNNSLTDYLKATQLVLPEYHPLRIIAEGVSKGLIKQKLQTIQDNKDYWVSQYNYAIKISQLYPQCDFSKSLTEAMSKIEECNKVIEEITQDSINDELQIKASDEIKKKYLEDKLTLLKSVRHLFSIKRLYRICTKKIFINVKDAA